MLKKIEVVEEVVVRDNELCINSDYFKVMLSDDEATKVMEYINTLINNPVTPKVEVKPENKPICQMVDKNKSYQVKDAKNTSWTWDLYKSKIGGKFNSLGLKCSWKVEAVEDFKTHETMYAIKHSGYLQPEKHIMEAYTSILTGVQTINLHFVDKFGRPVDYIRHGFKSELDARNAIKYLPERITEYMMQSYLNSGMTIIPAITLGESH